MWSCLLLFPCRVQAKCYGKKGVKKKHAAAKKGKSGGKKGKEPLDKPDIVRLDPKDPAYDYNPMLDAYTNRNRVLSRLYHRTRAPLLASKIEKAEANRRTALVTVAGMSRYDFLLEQWQKSQKTMPERLAAVAAGEEGIE